MKIDLKEILGVTLSGVRAEDREAVIALVGDSGLHVEDLTEEMLRDFLVARMAGELAGVVGLQFFGADALLRSFSVSEACRGQGLGSKLAASAEKAARSRGVSTLYLLTMTAEGFFAGQGYEKWDRSRVPEPIRATAEFSRLCPDSAVCMRKTLR